MLYTGRMKTTLTITLLLVAFAIAALAQDSKMTTTKSGLKYTDEKVGTGDIAVKGKSVQVNYTGWLYTDGKRGAKFDSSLDRHQPFDFILGAKQVIAQARSSSSWPNANRRCLRSSKRWPTHISACALGRASCCSGWRRM